MVIQTDKTVSAGLPAALALLLVLSLQTSHSQAIYELNNDGSLKAARQGDATVRDGYSSQPVFYTLGDDGTLSGSDNPASVDQQPGEEVVLATSPGRRLEISGSVVNVRQGPGLSQQVVTQLKRGDQVVSLQHAGSWVEVSPVESDQSLGWVYESLLVEVFGYSPVLRNSPIGKFRNELEKLKSDEKTNAIFYGLESTQANKNNSVSLVASDLWLDERAIDRWGAATLLGLTWRQLAPDDSAAVLNIVNEKGKRQMTVIRP